MFSLVHDLYIIENCIYEPYSFFCFFWEKTFQVPFAPSNQKQGETNQRFRRLDLIFNSGSISVALGEIGGMAILINLFL